MTKLTIRRVDARLHMILKENAQKQGVSLNRYMLALIQEAVGAGDNALLADIVYDDLDDLAGTWTQAEADEFVTALAGQRTLDEALWQSVE